MDRATRIPGVWFQTHLPHAGLDACAIQMLEVLDIYNSDFKTLFHLGSEAKCADQTALTGTCRLVCSFAVRIADIYVHAVNL